MTLTSLTAQTETPALPPRQAGLFSLSLASIGVVYGDIGTSPLYAFREAMKAAGSTTRADVLGVLSLITWALMIVVTAKYVLILLRADNQGEGGTLSLLALAQRALGRSTPWILALGVAGAALFYGDAVITPAISVLSAVEGLSLATTAFEPYVIPITLGIILGLFLAQSHGTAAVARFFGPITLVWFVVLAVFGVQWIAQDPGVLAALSPLPAITFAISHGTLTFTVLGAVFLAVTGAEALYADLGHFGPNPIRLAWLGVALPALVLNYLGQGALVLAQPETLANPFFLMFPDAALLPIVGLATAATIIASQAVISGAYSLTRQAIQLRLLPRMRMRHTSETQEGQIFMPGVNLALLVAVLALVLAFGSSAALANAYGIAVTGTMVVTAMLAIVVVHRHWHWPLAGALALILPFLAIDLIFLGANMLKVVEGGYVPLMMASAMGLLMWTWLRGTALISRKEIQAEVSFEEILRQILKRPLPVIPGTAVYLTSTPEVAPAALLHSLKHFKSLHEMNVILTIQAMPVPRVSDTDRVEMLDLSPRFRKVTLRFGYMEDPNVPKGLLQCRKLGWRFDIMATSFLLSRRTLKLSATSAMPTWQRQIYLFLARNSAGASDYFHIPAGRVVEIGTQVNI